MLCIILALVGMLLLCGFALFCYIFVRRRIPDPTSEEGREQGGWQKYRQLITESSAWLAKQEVRPLQVVSYDGKRLYGRLVQRKDANGTILLFHGYRSHYSVDFSASMEAYHNMGYNLLLCDQRAHGLSQGWLITFGIKEHCDVLSWVTYLSLLLGREHPMFLGGLSMGATSVLMAADTVFPGNVCGILADCGFLSPGAELRYLIDSRYHIPKKLCIAVINLFTRLLGGFGLDQWSTEAALQNSRSPVLLIHGTGDKLVPWQMSQRAFDACTSERELELFADAEHGQSYLKDGVRYRTTVENFLTRFTRQGEEYHDTGSDTL